MLRERIGFIGAGQMATALAQGLVKAQLTAGKDLLASDPLPNARELFAKATGCCQAKGGSMHIGDIGVGMIPAIAIVGAGAPIAAPRKDRRW